MKFPKIFLVLGNFFADLPRQWKEFFDREDSRITEEEQEYAREMRGKID